MAGYYSNCGSATDGVWEGWTTNTICGTSSATVVWKVWCGAEQVDTTCCGDAAPTTAQTVWTVWATTSDGQTRRLLSVPHADSSSSPRPRTLTAEEKAQAERRRVENERIRAENAERFRLAEEKRKAEAEAADKRAEELLVESLDAEQKAEYAKDKSFRVRTRAGRHYRIRRAWSGHVDRIGDCGRPVERFCIHPREAVPLPDNMLVAKLMLLTDEENFTRTANRTPILVPLGAN